MKMAERERERGRSRQVGERSQENWVPGARELEPGSRRGGRGGAGKPEAARDPSKAPPSLRRR